MIFFLTHLFLQRVSLKGRLRGHSQRNPKAKKGSPHRKSKVGLAMGPASDLELLKLLGVGPRAAPREESSSPVIALEGGIESREAA